MSATPENPPILPAWHLSRIVSTGLLAVFGALSTPVESASAFGVPVMLAQRAVDGLDSDPEVRGIEWDRETPAVLHGGGAGHIVDGVIPAGRPGLPPVNDPSPAVPSVLPAMPASLPGRPGLEPQGEGGAGARTAPAAGHATDLRVLMREYGARFDESQRAPAETAGAPGAFREAGSDVRWLDADERTVFREALRERHRRARH